MRIEVLFPTASGFVGNTRGKLILMKCDSQLGCFLDWKEQHKMWIAEGKPDTSGREIFVKNGGIGSIISNEGQGIGLDICHKGRGPAERIVVHGSGIGEIITNSGQGTGKRIVSTGRGAASESHVIVNNPVKMAAGLFSKLVIKNCDLCGRTVQFSKVIQGFSGDSEPSVSSKCPFCGGTNTI